MCAYNQLCNRYEHYEWNIYTHVEFRYTYPYRVFLHCCTKLYTPCICLYFHMERCIQKQSWFCKHPPRFGFQFWFWFLLRRFWYWSWFRLRCRCHHRCQPASQPPEPKPRPRPESKPKAKPQSWNPNLGGCLGTHLELVKLLCGFVWTSSVCFCMFSHTEVKNKLDIVCF